MPDFYNELNDYIQILLKSEAGLPARLYLESRGIDIETAKYWNLGYCPYGYIPRVYKELNNNENYKFWQKMYGRLIIPIFDQGGKLVSLSGRLVLNLNKPKYDHYPFSARKILFGLWTNKKAIQAEDRIIITEGQIDVISSWQHGLKIVTSSFGAHCSLDHFAIAARYASTIDIIYDEDKAGRNGTKMVEEFPTWGDLTVNLQTGLFPPGEDLDNWISKHSADELYRLINGSETDILRLKLKKMKGV